MKAHREAVRLAYDYVQPSYTLIVGRLEAAESRLQTTVNFATTLTFAVPALVATINETRRGVPEFGSPWFGAAIVAYVVIVGVGIWARFRGGHLRLADPKTVYTKWLPELETAEKFQGYALGYAARAFEHNRRLVNKRGNLAMFCSVLFAVELALLLVWVWRG